MLTLERIKHLHEQYLELVRLEVEEFGVKPTEVRHLIGRLAEFHCVLAVGGQLAYKVNQHGFDVTAPDGRTISVKGTAQKTGFVNVSKKTMHLADDVMIVQYSNGSLVPVYYGCIKRACNEAARLDPPTQSYEVDIGRARRMADGRSYVEAHKEVQMLDFSVDAERSIVHLRPKAALTKEDFATLTKAVDPHIDAKGGLAGIIVEIGHFPGWESLGAMAAHFRFVRDHHKKVRKVAVVTDLKLGDVAQKLASHFVAAEIKHFPVGQAREAEKWIAG